MKPVLTTLLLFILLLPLGSRGSQSLSANLTSTTRPTCYGLCNGSASVTASGGTAPYHYHWSAEGGDTSTASNLCEGNYSVTISDSGGSTPVSFSFHLSGPQTLDGTATFLGSPTCMGVPTDISATGGTPPYTGTGYFVTPPGQNVYIVSDFNGCIDTVPVSVPFSTIQISVTTDTACVGGTTRAVVTASGGHPPYSGTGTFQVGGGIHYFTVYDSMGCFGTDSAIVPTYPRSVVTVGADTSVICSNDSVHICASPGYSSYLWTITGSTTSCTTTNMAGDYYVVATDQNSCHIESNHIEITVRAPFAVSISLHGDTLQSFNAISYQWYYNLDSIPNADSQLLVARKNGEYAVAVTDSYGCMAMSTQVSVTLPTNGIETINNQSFQVYPNPVMQPTFNVVVTNDLIGAAMEIYDETGRIVYRLKVQSLQNEINLDVPAGTYLIRIQSADKVVERKLVRL